MYDVRATVAKWQTFGYQDLAVRLSQLGIAPGLIAVHPEG